MNKNWNYAISEQYEPILISLPLPGFAKKSYAGQAWCSVCHSPEGDGGSVLRNLLSKMYRTIKQINFLVPFFILFSFIQSTPLLIRSTQQQKPKLIVGLIQPSAQLKEIATLVKDDLSCMQMKKSGFNITIQEFDGVPNKKVFRKLYDDGYALALFMTEKDGGVQWHVYDCLQTKMMAGKKVAFSDSIPATAHFVADKAWHALTGQEGIFSTTIAYCKERHEDNRYFKDIFVQNPFTAQFAPVVHGGKPLAPRWNHDPNHPLLLYSEATPSNIRLMSVTLDGNRKIVSNFDGLNILPSFSPDGHKVAYCFSYEGKSQIFCYSFDPITKKSRLKRITHNMGNNVSPTLRDNGDIIFCSDYQTKAPQVYYYHADSGSIERLTTGGYCAAPSFCEQNQRIAYCKMINGVSQICMYDLKTKKDLQITHDIGCKDECSWSPCGNYLVYAYEKDRAKRIAIMNLITREQTFLTNSKDLCCYPSWSPQYNQYVAFK